MACDSGDSPSTTGDVSSLSTATSSGEKSPVEDSFVLQMVLCEIHKNSQHFQHYPFLMNWYIPSYLTLLSVDYESHVPL